MKLYSLFARPYGSPPRTRWTRVDSGAYPRAAAVRVYQNRLLANVFKQYMPDQALCLRAVKD